jgi:hypothetical protein
LRVHPPGAPVADPVELAVEEDEAELDEVDDGGLVTAPAAGRRGSVTSM